MKTIIDYNAKIEYSMNYASNTCKKTVLTTNELSCLGKNGNNATIIDRTHFGAGGQQIPVEIYSGLVGGYPSYFSVSEGCIPVGITYHGMDANGNGVIGSIGYHDITSGVSDTSVFDLPAKCISAPLENIVVG
ncbi:ependymin-related protein 1-like [Saccostrea cucullata]|uniref:ependymin-related protein 1-like n=1 Tax=Saccostrea cuccullata TaxID=36930 RepID=UPI002ED2BA2A